MVDTRYADVLDADNELEDADLDAAYNRPRGTRNAASIRPEAIDWLWQDRIPLGMTTVFAGMPGVGKSTLLYDQAARQTRRGRTVLVMTAEDHLAAVVRPRLEVAGAVLERVEVVTDPITLPDDVERITTFVDFHRASFVIIDPLVAFIGDAVNTHRDHHVRRVLAPLGDMAQATRTAVVVVIHTNKGSSSNGLMRISGSIGFTGAARSVLMAANDPDDDTRRILWVEKSNLAKIPSPLAYRLVQANVGDIETSKVEWLGEAPDVDISNLLNVDRKGRKGDAARRFLLDRGVLNDPQPAANLEAEAESMGINYKALRRAREDLGIDAWKDGYQGPWWWGTKGDKAKGTTRAHEPSPSRLPAETEPSAPKGDRACGVGGPPDRTAEVAGIVEVALDG
jgi:putative DNA primase/helicase